MRLRQLDMYSSLPAEICRYDSGSVDRDAYRNRAIRKDIFYVMNYQETGTL